MLSTLRKFNVCPFMDLIVFVCAIAGASFIGLLMVTGGMPLHRAVYTAMLVGCVFPAAAKCLDISLYNETFMPIHSITPGNMLKRWHWMSIPCGIVFISIPLFYGF